MSSLFDSLLIHPRTKHQILNFLESPSHGLILTGPAGSGKQTLALAMAAELLGLRAVDDLQKYPYFSLTNPEGTSITIDEVRALQQLLTLRTPHKPNQAIRRIFLIINAGRMRFEAQNAFLKSLEEPPADTCIIFTADGGKDLLPTIYSRMQAIAVQPVSEQQAGDYYRERGVSAAELKKHYALSQGQVGLLSSLLQDETHPLRDWVETAKKLLARPASERLFEVEPLSKDKVAAQALVMALNRIAHAALRSASSTGSQAALKRWHTCLQLTTQAAEAMQRNANTKLVLDHLLLNL